MGGGFAPPPNPNPHSLAKAQRHLKFSHCAQTAPLSRNNPIILSLPTKVFKIAKYFKGIYEDWILFLVVT